MSDNHEHYDKLTDAQRNAVDEVFRQVPAIMKAHNVRLAGDDRIERAVDALAAAILSSQPMVDLTRYPATVMNPANGRMLKRITAQELYEGVDAEESYVLNPDNLETEQVFGNAFTEIHDIVRKLAEDGSIGLSFFRGERYVSGSYPVYIG